MARLFGRRPPEVPAAPPAVPARVERVVELPPPPKPLKPGSAVAAVMGAGEAESFENTPFGGNSHGAMLPPPEPEQQPAPQPVGLEIPPPPWQHELDSGNLDLDALGPSERQPAELAALDQMKLADAEEIPPWGPPVPPTQPLEAVRPRIPEADWHLEQQEATPTLPAAEPPAPRPVFPRPDWDQP